MCEGRESEQENQESVFHMARILPGRSEETEIRGLSRLHFYAREKVQAVNPQITDSFRAIADPDVPSSKPSMRARSLADKRHQVQKGPHRN